MGSTTAEIKLLANKIDGTQDLTDANFKDFNYGVIGLMESARDGTVKDFQAKWNLINLNRGVAFESTDVKFGDQKMGLEMLYAKQIQALAKLYEDEELARALAELHEDEERAQALAKLYEDEEEDEGPDRALYRFNKDKVAARAIAKIYKDEERARALAKLYEDKEHVNLNEPEKRAVASIRSEVKKIVCDVEQGDWRKKKTQSTNGDQKGEDVAVCNGLCGLGCKGAKDRVPDPKAKNRVADPKAKEKGGKGGWHVLRVIRNALPAIYPGRTALHMAAANGNAEIVGVICAVPDIDLNKRDVFGYTPLHLACYSTHPKRHEVIKILLASQSIDANVAARAKGYYFTPLHLAVKAKSTGIVDMLLDWCPIGFKNILGTSRVHAIEKQYKELYTAPVNKFFKIGEEDDAASSHGGSVLTSSVGNENSGGETGDSSV
ncbi:unnamed protein product [Sphagnum tenellum]